MVFLLYFAEPETISVQDAVDTLHIDMNLDEFKTFGGEFIPKGSSIKRDLPA